MPTFQFQQLKKLIQSLRSYLKKEPFLVDIFLFGSAFRAKERPRDVDIVVLLREKNYKRTEEEIYKISKMGRELELDLHIEPILIDNLHKERIYVSILHEGYSIKHSAFLRELLNFKAYSLISYSLKGKTPSEKVRFYYVLHGRKKGQGFLASVKGKELGKGNILVPIEKEEIIKELMAEWKLDFKTQRIIAFE